ncbi:MAG: 30S ribosomal protein S3 [bacterium]|nr:30S ribosomal protein S3 [bacterium]
MARKVNPISLRLLVNKDWQSKWFDKKDYRQKLKEDLEIREAIKKKFTFRAGIAKVEIERSATSADITIYTSRPGVVIGRGGAGTDELKKIITKITPADVKINIEEIADPETNAQLIADNIAAQLEKRIGFRRAIKISVENAIKAGALGAKATVSGRLNGAEMSRRETTLQGSIPLHTIRADIDYALSQARTTYGVIGVKVWIYKGRPEA